MAILRETAAKSILGKSGISDYCVNCYTGCLHNCVYCYARFMKRFSGHEEPWGQFLDIKVNAPEILLKEVKRKAPGHVFMSSVCDGWQPAEEKYQLSRRCLRLLVETGFDVGILTKSSLVARDIDIMRGHTNVQLGMTISTVDESIRRKIEPAASSSSERLETLRKAADAGIRTYVFLGPLMPFLTDTDEQLDCLFAAVSALPIESAMVDKLNARPGVWNAVAQYLRRHHPELLEPARRALFNADDAEEYKADLRSRIVHIADAHGFIGRLQSIF